MRIVHMRIDPVEEVVVSDLSGDEYERHSPPALPKEESVSENDSPTNSPQLRRAAETDPPQYVDLAIPEDAGKYRDALTFILLRIPDGWNRSISCGAGWYPLIAKLHVALCDVDIDYQILQVKEKYGTLRYYAETDTENAQVQERFDALIAAAELRSAEVCEWCGNPGHLSSSGTYGGRWYKTLCPYCIDSSGERGRPFSRVAAR